MPVIVTVVEPVVALAAAPNARLVLLVAGLGVKLAETPPGRADVVKLTIPENPFVGLIVIVLVAWGPP